MTVLVGILCQDGVVLGSDSSATFGNAHVRTIEQTCQKLFAVGNTLMFAGTGQVGLGQRFEAVLMTFAAKYASTSRPSPIEVGKIISAATIHDFQQTGAPKEFGALVAFSGSNKTFGLVEFGWGDFQPEIKTSGMWFASMGSGQAIVDPFLGLMKRAFFKNTQPKLTEGIFAAVWALNHAIELNPGGINGPIQLGIIGKNKTGNMMEARLLTDDELEEHKQNVAAATEHLATYRDKLSGDAPSEAAMPPVPPPPKT